MDCQQARTRLLQAEDPRPDGSAELAAHLESCAACRRLSAKVLRLEQAWRDLPLPARAEQAREAFLTRLPRRPVRRRQARVAPPPWWRTAPARWAVAAVAASVVIAAVALWLFFPHKPVLLREAQAPSRFVERLLDWNLALAQATSPAERTQLYNAQAAAMKSDLQEAPLLAEDRELADTLVANAGWLAEHDDPVAEADHFNDVADKLLAQMHAATNANDSQRVARLTDFYSRVEEIGVAANLKRAEIVGPMPQGQEEKLQKVADRQEHQTETLEKLANRAPDKQAQKKIQQAHAAAKKHKPKPKPHRPKKPVERLPR
jgi:hypothetical protein